MMRQNITGYRLHWQDFTGRRIGVDAPMPPWCHTDHATLTEAQAARDALVKSDDLVGTITPIFASAKAKVLMPPEWVAELPTAKRPAL